MICDHVGKARSIEHLTPHVREERLARRPLHHRAHEVPAVARVAPARPGLEQERVVGEDRESLSDSRVVPRALELRAAVMADPRQVPCNQAGGDRPALDGEFRHVGLDGDVEIERPALDESPDGDRGDGLGDAADPEFGERRHRDLVLEVRPAESLRPDDVLADSDRNRQARNAARHPQRIEEHAPGLDRIHVAARCDPHGGRPGDRIGLEGEERLRRNEEGGRADEEPAGPASGRHGPSLAGEVEFLEANRQNSPPP